MRKSGIENEILKLHKQGVTVFGICGGYQMLGLRISDPHKTESNLLQIEGIGLLNVKTVFQQKKITTQIEARVSEEAGMLKGLNGIGIKGYEIHMGTTEYEEGCIPYLTINRVLEKESMSAGGVRNEAGTVFGTYIHGIFDNMEFSLGFVNNLRKKKGLDIISGEDTDFTSYKEAQYDRLASIIRANLDMKKVYEILEK